MHLERIVVSQLADPDTATVRARVDYHLSDTIPEQSRVLIERGIGTVRVIDTSAGLRARQEKNGERQIIEVESLPTARRDDERVSLRINWDSQSMAQLDGYPIRALPGHLPEYVSEHSPYPYTLARWPAPVARLRLPALDLGEASLFHTGWVRNGDSQLVMVSIPQRSLTLQGALAAIRKRDEWIRERLLAAQACAKVGSRNAALDILAEVLHAYMDSDSPAHSEDGKPLPWPSNPIVDLIHVAGPTEADDKITPAIYEHQRQLLNLAYNFVFSGS